MYETQACVIEARDEAATDEVAAHGGLDGGGEGSEGRLVLEDCARDVLQVERLSAHTAVIAVVPLKDADAAASGGEVEVAAVAREQLARTAAVEGHRARKQDVPSCQATACDRLDGGGCTSWQQGAAAQRSAADGEGSGGSC